METQKQYLRRIGAYEKSPEELAQAKREYRRWYQKTKKKAYRTESVRYEITFNFRENERITTLAKSYGVSVPTLLKMALFAYFDKTYLVPKQDEIYNLALQIKRIGVNVNQQARIANTTQEFSRTDFVRLSKRIGEMEVLMDGVFTHPIELNEAILSQLRKDPQFALVLEKLIETTKKC